MTHWGGRRAGSIVRLSFPSNDSVRATFAWRAGAAVHSSEHARSHNIPSSPPSPAVNSVGCSQQLLTSSRKQLASTVNQQPSIFPTLRICFLLSGSGSFSLLLPTHGYLVIVALRLDLSSVYPPWWNHEPPGHNVCVWGYLCYGNTLQLSLITWWNFWLYFHWLLLLNQNSFESTHHGAYLPRKPL